MDVARFLLDVDASVAALAADLGARTYRPGRGRFFRIIDPKPRSIYALPFRDRVAQHLLIARTLPAIERRLAPQTYACREDKGTHRALARAAELARRARFVLLIDVRRFFASIDHALLRRMLVAVTPIDLRWLSDAFFDLPSEVDRAGFVFPGDDLFAAQARPHGLPIGSLTSQIWANLYLAPIDHLIASAIGLGSFVHYCGDLLVYDDDAGRLRDALARVEDRALALRLRLHPRKTRLHRTTDPVPFVGFVIRRRGDAVSVRLKHENVAAMRARVTRLRVLFAAGAVSVDEVRARVHAWIAHAAHGHTARLLAREAGWPWSAREAEERTTEAQRHRGGRRRRWASPCGEGQGAGSWTTRLIPSRRAGTLKLMSRPCRRPVAFR